MARRRVYAPDFSGQKKTVLDAAESHHILQVLRLAVGSELEVFDGKGNAATARLSGASADQATLDVGEPLPSLESSFALTLAVCPPKGERMDGLVRQVTEMGVVAIHPLTSRYSTMDDRLIVARTPRWERIALQALKQSGRSHLPGIAPPRSVDSLLMVSKSPAFVADLASSGSSFPPLPDADLRHSVVLIGPEGGWSEDERRRMDEVGSTRFHLGPRTLRVETAAIVAVGLLQARYGDLSSPAGPGAVASPE